MSLVKWKFKKPDWKNDRAYDGIENLSHKQLAWEFLRRSRRYRIYYLASLSKESEEEREQALIKLQKNAPLIWFVPKKGYGKYYRSTETLGDFIGRKRKDTPRSVQKMLRVRRLDPSIFALTRFVDPNETPLGDESIFDGSIIDCVLPGEDWDARSKKEFFGLNDFDVLVKMDLRYSQEEIEASLRKRLKEIRKSLREKYAGGVGIKDRKGDRVTLLRSYDARMAKAKPEERNNILFPINGKAVVGIKKAYFENVKSARSIVQSRYRYLARLP